MQQDTSISPGRYQEILRGNAYVRDCSTRQLLDRIGDKWSVLILVSLAEKEARFSGLKRRIDRISQKILSQTLRSLERGALVTRHTVATVPVTVC